MPSVYLICGFLGVGKTTFSRELADRDSAIRFSLDEIYLELFADGPTHELDLVKMNRVSAVVEKLWTSAVGAGASVVLDLGFWSKMDRDRTRALASSLGAPTRLYWLLCPDDIALQRCINRNGSPGSFLVSPEGFGEMKSRFEPPGDEENAVVIRR